MVSGLYAATAGNFGGCGVQPLDVSMNEDACLICRGESAEILSCIRHIALNMLRAEKTKKASIRRKRKIASMNSAYLEQVLVAGFSSLVEK